MRIAFLLPVISLSVLITACSGESASQNEPLEDLALSFSPVIHDGDDCQVLRVAEIDQDRHPLYMVRGETLFTRVDDSSSTRIPLQIQFRGLDGRQREESTSLPELGADCSEVVMTITIDECINQAREVVACPKMALSGEDAFAAINIELP